MNITEIIRNKIQIDEYLSDHYGAKIVSNRCSCPIHHGNNITSFCILGKFAVCYACGHYSDIIGIVMAIENINYMQAVSKLCEEYGIKIDTREIQQIVDIDSTYRTQSKKYADNNQYVEYLLKERKLTQKDIDIFNIGSDGTSITFPLRTLSGVYGGISRRNMHYEAEGKPKYKHTKGNELLEKGNYLYGLYEALPNIRRQRKVFITEGYFDAISGNSQDCPTLAWCGSVITKGQIETLIEVVKDLLPRFSVYVIPDNDDKHYVNAYNIRERFRKYAPQLSVKIALLQNGCKDFSDAHISGDKISEYPTQSLDVFILRGEIQKCNSSDEEYNVSKEIINQIKNELIKSECVSFLSERWGKTSQTISEWLQVRNTDNDLLLAFKTPNDGISELITLYTADKMNTGWSDIDDSIRSMYKSEIFICAARPQCGKTWFGCQMAINLMRQDKKGLFISLEMSTAAIYERLISMWIKKPIKNIDDLTAYQDLVEQAKQEIKNNLYVISENRICNTIDKISNLISFANQRIFDRNVDFVVIDFLQYLEGCTQYENLSREANNMVPLAKEHKIFVLALSQLSRLAKANERPSLEHLRGAGELEQVAHLAVGLYRPFYRSDAGDPNIIMLDIMKARRGTKKYEFPLRFNPDTYNLEQLGV